MGTHPAPDRRPEPVGQTRTSDGQPGRTKPSITRLHPESKPEDLHAARKAKDALKLRYAHGEISREEYLQGKVELED
jgi:hypothetical protein